MIDTAPTTSEQRLEHLRQGTFPPPTRRLPDRDSRSRQILQTELSDVVPLQYRYLTNSSIVNPPNH